MTREERLDLIDQLQRQAAEGRARIAAMERRRLEDPYTEPMPSPLVHKSTARGLIYRVTDNNALRPASGANGGPSEGDVYPPIDDLREAIAEFVVEWVNKKLTVRDERISKLEAKIDALLTLLGQKPPKLWTPGDGAA
jgi:hypothetical protein